MNKIIAIAKSSGNVYIGDSPESRVDAVINELLNILSGQDVEDFLIKRRPPARAVVKINHNNIGSKKHIIKQYVSRSAAIERAFQEIDSVVPFGKNVVLRSLNDLYFAALDEVEIDYMSSDEIDIEKVRENSDFIIDFIINKLKEVAFGSKNVNSYREEIESGIGVIVAHAFIECVILEAPENDS